MRELKRAVVYGKPRQRECAAVAEGLSALGAAVSWRNQGYSDESNILDDVDVAVTFGQRLHSGRVAETYRERGVPVLTVDLPPLRHDGMAETHRSLWLDQVNWLPKGECKTDRIEPLGSGYVKMRPDRGGSEILVCGQTECDAAHGMDAVALRRWATETLQQVSMTHRASWRPHPRCIFTVAGFPMDDPERQIEEALAEDWHAVVTYNSTAGLTALLAGLPVYCDPSCFYADIAQTDLLHLSDPTWPSESEWLSYFSRLSYVQWTFEELANGAALEFIWHATEDRKPSLAA